MRLICPNCDAQYEVVSDVIPADGRDVQCSDCGQTWFQHHPDHMSDVRDEPDLPEDLTAHDDAPAIDEERVKVPSTPMRKQLDASVADILRQEAELENKARGRVSDALESQPELGLDSTESDAARRSREARDRMGRMRGEAETPAAEAAATAAAIGSRRDLLPDIEEINSTLRSTSDRQSGAGADASGPSAAAAPVEAKSGFRRGFILMLALALILGAVYVAAPQIAQAVPQADPFLSAYVAQVDMARGWLDGQMTTFLTWLDTLASDQGG